MKATKLGNLYQITYRCPNFPRLINERFETEEEANLRIAQIQLDRKLGKLLPPPELVNPESQHDLYRKTITIRQLMTEYVTLYGLNHWSAGTLSCNQHRIDDYIIPYIGDLPVCMLTTHRLELFYRDLLKEPAVKMKGHQTERTISPSVVEKVHAILRSALNQAIRWDYLQGNNPALAVELRRCDKASVEQLRKEGRDDIFLTFPSMKQAESTTVLVLKTPKTESSVRSIYLPRAVALAMQEMKAEQERLKRELGSEYMDYHLVIALENGRPYEERLIAKKFKDMIEAHNLPPVVFHSLRHSSTSMKLKISGGDIKTVQKDTGEWVCQGIFSF